jgi:WS/DGAT/MGAT family acyltransferase
LAYCHYERLTALDCTFLDQEDGNAHMHIGAIALFDAAPLAREGGGIRFDAIFEHVAAALRKNDRFQQKLARIPGVNQPVWVDDAKFNLHYHVHHACLPAPGDERVLKRLVGRIMSEELDRGKPLWELWFIEGVEGDRFAVMSKIHHSLSAGLSGDDLFSVILAAKPKAASESVGKWLPRPAPSGGRLLVDDLKRRARLPFSLASIGSRAVADAGKTAAAVRDAFSGIGEVLRTNLFPASETPFNQPLGPHRRFDWIRSDLEEVKMVRRRLGGTVNDVVLCAVAGGVRRFMTGRGLQVSDLDFRVLVPKNVQTEGREGRLESRIAMQLTRLPIEETNPRRRLDRIVETTHEQKSATRTHGSEVLTEIADWTHSGFLAQVAHFGLQTRIANFVVTNVSGPTEPLYLLRARVREVFPIVSLAANQGLGIALFSYAGGLYWGLNADWDLLPDLHDFVEAVEAEFDQLRRLAAEKPVVRKAAKASPRRRKSVAATGATAPPPQGPR